MCYHTHPQTHRDRHRHRHRHTHLGEDFWGRIWGDNVHRHRRDLIHKQKRPTIQEKETY